MRVRTIIGLLVVVGAVIVCAPFAPTNLGGHTTYVATHGTSMVPRFHAGDLAIVQPTSAYHVGEIAAYHSTTLRGETVLHRIIAIRNGHYSFKGDNNNFVDPDHPTAAQLVGRLRFRVPHGGEVRAWLGRPIVLFPLLALAIGGLGWSLLATKSRRRRRRHAPQRGSIPRERNPLLPRRRLGVVVPIAVTLAVAGYLLAAVAIWHMPSTQTVRSRDPYAQSLTARYSGAAPRGAAYPDGKIKTGDPVFTRLVKRIDIDFAYALHADANFQPVGGTYDVIADITSTTGLQRSVAIASARTFSGTHFDAKAVLDLDTVRRIEARFSSETGLDTTDAAITVSPRVHLVGEAGGTPFSSDITSKLQFQFGAQAMLPTSIAAGSSGANGSKTTQGGSVTISGVRPNELSLWKLRVPAAPARVIVLLALALSLCGAALIMAADRRRVAGGEVDAIVRRYGRLLISTRTAPPTGERSMVRVDSMRALVRLAHLHEQLIVHSDTAGVHRFVLLTEIGGYYYDAAAPGALTPGPHLVAA